MRMYGSVICFAPRVAFPNQMFLMSPLRPVADGLIRIREDKKLSFRCDPAIAKRLRERSL